MDDHRLLLTLAQYDLAATARDDNALQHCQTMIRASQSTLVVADLRHVSRHRQEQCS